MAVVANRTSPILCLRLGIMEISHPLIPPTTMYLWLISLTAGKELSILLLKLLE